MSDTGANIATLSASQIGPLGAGAFSGITSTGGGVTLSVAEALALEFLAKLLRLCFSKVTIATHRRKSRACRCCTSTRRPQPA